MSVLRVCAPSDFSRRLWKLISTWITYTAFDPISWNEDLQSWFIKLVAGTNNAMHTLAIVRNDRQYKRRRTADQTQGTRDFNVENPPKVEGKNHGHQPANLHYIG